MKADTAARANVEIYIVKKGDIAVAVTRISQSIIA